MRVGFAVVDWSWDLLGETGRARRAHLAYVTELAETADPHLRRSGQLAWPARPHAEHGNITTALRVAIAEGWAAPAMRLVAAVGRYWFLSGRRTGRRGGVPARRRSRRGRRGAR